MERQSWQPRHQQEGALINADGWGVGWWDHAVRPEPARYRTATPIWADQAFRSTSSLVSASAIFAAVRAATPPLPVVETGNAPFAAGPWLFSLNGFVAGFAGPPGEQLRRQISIERVTGVEGHTDSEVLFALVLDRLDAGLSPADALSEVVRVARAEAPGRLNLLLSDGHRGLPPRWAPLCTSCTTPGWLMAECSWRPNHSTTTRRGSGSPICGS